MSDRDYELPTRGELIDPEGRIIGKAVNEEESWEDASKRVFRELHEAMANLEKGFADHLAWCSTHTHWPPEHSFEAVRDAVFSESGDNRVTAAHQRITGETHRLNELRDLLEKTDRALSMHNDRISQVESRLNAYGVPEARGEYRDLTPKKAGPVFTGPVIPPGDYTTPDGIRLAMTQARKESYDQGYEWGKAEALEHARRMDPLFYADVEAGVLETAISRVKKYMIGSFSKATIGGVVQAIKGEFDGVVQAIKGEPIELRRGWADLITQSQAEDVRTVLSEPAEDATVEPFHAPFGPKVEPIAEELPKRRPIRDNPQA